MYTVSIKRLLKSINWLNLQPPGWEIQTSGVESIIFYSLEKTPMLGKIEGRRRKGWEGMRWLDDIINSMDMILSEFQEIVKGQGSLACCIPWGRKELDTTQWLNNNFLYLYHFFRSVLSLILYLTSLFLLCWNKHILDILLEKHIVKSIIIFFKYFWSSDIPSNIPWFYVFHISWLDKCKSRFLTAYWLSFSWA